MLKIPDQIRGNSLSRILDKFRLKYGQLSRIGRLNGLLIADQDAKVLAVNSFFDNKINYWDIGAIGGALFGVAKQGKDFFSSSDLERASLIYQNIQFFVHSIGEVKLNNGNKRELIMIAIGDRSMNIGLIVMQMQKFATKIKDQVEKDELSQNMMKMSENEFYKHIEEIKREIFDLV